MKSHLSRFSLGVHHTLLSHANVFDNTEMVLRGFRNIDNKADRLKRLVDYCCSVVTSGELREYQHTICFPSLSRIQNGKFSFSKTNPVLLALELQFINLKTLN